MILRFLIFSLSLACSAVPVLAQTTPFTALDNPASSDSLAPRMAALDDGRVLMSWLERIGTGKGDGHRFRYSIFENGAFGDAHTIAEGDRFFANWADTPGVVVMPGGGWLAHWLVRSGQGTYAYDVHVAVSHDQVGQWSKPFSPHDDGTYTEHGFVSHFPAGEAATGLVWLDGRDTQPAAVDGGGHAGHDGHSARGAMTLRTAQVDASGNVKNGALLDDRVCDCCGTAAALTSEGPVVVYRDRSADEIRDIMLVRHDERGWSAPVPVHADGWRISACPVNGPAVLARESAVIVAWFTMSDDGVPRIRVARSMDAGRTFAAPVTLGMGIAEGRVDLAWAGQGFVLTWLATTGVVRAARFDANVGLLGQHDLVNLDAGRGSGFPRLVALGAGRFLLAWTDTGVRTGIIHLQPGR